MNLKPLLLLPVVVVLFAGCGGGKPAEPPPATNAAPTSIDDYLPKQAQPKLPTMKIFLGAEVLDAEVARSQWEQAVGMMFRTNIQETDAMIFTLPYTMRASFWMKNCPESISAAYISPEGEILEVHHLEQNDTNPVVAASENIRFVLETKEGWFGRHNIAPGTVIRTEKGSLAETFLKGK
jgi:hypothetical protein